MQEKIKIGKGSRQVAVTVFPTIHRTKTIIFAGAMGVRRQFYSEIARFFQKKGYTCVTFDYVGMFHGKDVPSGNTIACFGKEDLQEVISYCTHVLESKEIFLVGHSISGQVLPLAPDANKLTAAYLVASQSVSAHLWQGKSKWTVSVFWYLLTPLATRLLNFMPARLYGGKYPLSKAIASDWARLAKTASGIFGDNDYNMAHYQKYRVPTKFISIEGDNLLAPRKAVEDLFSKYSCEIKSHEHLSFSDYPLRNLDHFNYFRNKNNRLWEDIVNWFEDAQGQPELPAHGLKSDPVKKKSILSGDSLMKPGTLK